MNGMEHRGTGRALTFVPCDGNENPLVDPNNQSYPRPDLFLSLDQGPSTHSKRLYTDFCANQVDPFVDFGGSNDDPTLLPMGECPDPESVWHDISMQPETAVMPWQEGNDINLDSLIGLDFEDDIDGLVMQQAVDEFDILWRLWSDEPVSFSLRQNGYLDADYFASRSYSERPLFRLLITALVQMPLAYLSSNGAIDSVCVALNAIEQGMKVGKASMF